MKSPRGDCARLAGALHSLVGEYIKCIKQRGFLESEMTERILKSSTSTLGAFNKVRNEQSFAYDNEVLNNDESLLILGHVTGTVNFIPALERKMAESTRKEPESTGEYGLPF